jgi:hypothetical protein
VAEVAVSNTAFEERISKAEAESEQKWVGKYQELEAE